MKRMFLFFVFSVSFVFSQSNENYVKITEFNSINNTPETIILDSPVSNRDFIASQAIILKPGFHGTPNIYLKTLTSNNIPNQESITYFDGLGKPKQQIAVGQSPERKDIIQHIEYNEFGRVSKQFLPHEYSVGTLGTYRTGTNLSTKAYYKNKYPEDFPGPADVQGISETTPYSERNFELSPLNRLEKQSSPGELFKMGSGHELKFEYKINATHEVKKYIINNDGTLGGGNSFYAEGELNKSIVKGQNWKLSDNKNYTTEEFKDKLGKVILKRVYNNNEPHDTYFVYDYLDNLKYVLPPKLIEAYSNNTIYSNYSTNWSLNDFLEGGTTLKSLSFVVVNDVINISGTFSNKNFSSFKLKPLTTKSINSIPVIPNMTLGIIRGVTTWSVFGGSITEDIGEIKIENGNLVIVRTKDIGFLSADINISKTLSNSGTISQDVFNNLAYQYKYDEWNRLVEKKLPGKQWEYIIYDSNDRRILTQDGTLKANNLWAFTKYDTYGRNIYTGLYSSTKSRTNLQIDVDNYINTNNENNSEDRITTTKTIGQVVVNYENTAFPTTNITEVLAVNYYDDYNFTDSDKPSIPTSVLNQTVTKRTNGLHTSSWVKTLGKNTWAKAYTFYDEKGRELRVYSKNHIGGYTMVDSEIDFSGIVTKTISSHKKTIADALVSITDEFEYDHAKRLKKQTQQINSAPKEVIASNVYDGLGMLTQKKVGGVTNSLQTLDYKYNVQGSLTSINDVNSNLLTTSDNDLFAFKLNYENTVEGTARVPQLFNGNVTQTIWKNSITNDKQSYTYNYDDLSRISNANYTKGTALNIDANKFNLSNVTYDKGGNINTLQRTGTNGQIDNLSYKYETVNAQTTNKLIDVSDTTNNAQGYNDITGASESCYTYDANGRLIADKNKGVASIQYNYLDLPTIVTFSNGNKIEITYDASGNKLEKLYVTSGGNIKTLYVDGFQYQNDKLQFLGHSEGYTYKDGSTYKYAYVHRDHLGNNRVSYSDTDGNGTISNSEILSKTDYYPFGLSHSGELIAGVGSNYNYKYQGKELQQENGLQQYDFGSRMYDASTGRWHVIDPQAEQFYGMSPYMAMGNNPIIIVDPNGEVWHIVIGAIVGGIINVVQNWDNIGSFEEGLGYFGVGAASGAVVAATGNLAAGGAIMGLGNGLMQGQRGYDLLKTTAMSTATSVIGGGLGKAIGPMVSKLGVDKLTKSISSNILRNAINSGVNNAISGSIVGGTLSAATGGEFLDGFKQGAAIGFGSGFALGAYNGHIENKALRAKVGKLINNPTKQGEHIEGSKPYLNRIKVRKEHPSVLTEDPQSLLNDFHAGKGIIMSDRSARKSMVFKFRKPIGNVIDQATGIIITKGTFYGAVKYGKNTHITPVNWKK